MKIKELATGQQARNAGTSNMTPTPEKETLITLAQRHGDALGRFVLAKLQKERANLEFERIQREVRDIEAELQDMKWGQMVV